MKTVKDIKSQTKPEEGVDYSSDSTVVVRYNIKETVETDPVFGTETTVYTYDEEQYTASEWNNLIIDGVVTEHELMEQHLDTTQLALIEALDLIMNPNKVTIKKDQFSAISTVYGRLIARELITIEKVPNKFKEEVKEYLNSNE